jgi:hypothetical protein
MRPSLVPEHEQDLGVFDYSGRLRPETAASGVQTIEPANRLAKRRRRLLVLFPGQH